jgi:hypothetical protein
MSADWKTEVSPKLASLSGLDVKDYSHFDFGRQQNPECISVLIEETKSGVNPFKAVVGLIDGVFGNSIARKNADALMLELRKNLEPGYVAFVGTTRWLGQYKPHGVELVVGPAQSQFDIVRHAKADAPNFDLSTEDLVKKLEQYDKDAGINITHAETDTIDFELLKLPENLEHFAEDLYEFCPDLVDQGCGSISALVAEIRQHKRVQLWWD